MAAVRLYAFFVLANLFMCPYGQDVVRSSLSVVDGSKSSGQDQHPSIGDHYAPVQEHYASGGDQYASGGDQYASGGKYASGHDNYRQKPYYRFDHPETTTGPTNRTGCIDRKGRTVKFGEDYNPSGHSPCTICQCLEDPRMMSCSSEGCDSLKCLNFEIDPDSCCGYTCRDNNTAASLDVRQVGKDSVIVQWEMDKQFSNYTIAAMKLAYSNDSGMYGKLDFQEVPVIPGTDSVIVSGLQSGMRYTFNGVGQIEHELYPVEIPLKAAQIGLEPRSSNALELQRRHHEKKILVKKGAGKFKWPKRLFVNTQTFNLITEEKKRNKAGKEWMAIKLHNLNSGGVLSLMTKDVKTYRWIMAHV